MPSLYSVVFKEGVPEAGEEIGSKTKRGPDTPQSIFILQNGDAQEKLKIQHIAYVGKKKKWHHDDRYPFGGYAKFKKFDDDRTAVKIYHTHRYLTPRSRQNTWLTIQREVEVLRSLGLRAELFCQKDRSATYKANTITYDKIYLRIDVVEGVDLFDSIYSVRSLSILERLKLLRGLLLQIQALHEKGFIVKDIKEENIIYNEEAATPYLKLVDFGGCIRTDEDDSCQIYRLGLTHECLDEENFNATKDASIPLALNVQSDIFAFGLVAANLFPEYFRVDHKNGELTLVSGRWQGAAAATLAGKNTDVKELILKMVTKHRSQRYKAVPDIVKDLDAAISRIEKAKPAKTAAKRSVLSRLHNLLM